VTEQLESISKITGDVT